MAILGDLWNVERFVLKIESDRAISENTIEGIAC
jgi:hypothetical protein